MAICNLYQPYNASFRKIESTFGGAVWVGGVVKVVRRAGLVKLRDANFAYNKNV